MTLPRRAAVALLASASILAGATPLDAHGADQGYRVLVFWAERVSFERLLDSPEVRALARVGGAGLLTSPRTVRRLVAEILHAPAYPNLDEDVVTTPMSAGGVVLGARIRQIVEATPGELLVIVAGVTASRAMEEANDRVAGIVVASGHGDELFPAHGEPRALTSDSTRRDGVIAAVDVPASILAFLDWPLEGVDGSPIRVADVRPPFELHERHLANMRLWTPVQVGAGVYFLVAALACLALLLARRAVPARIGRFAAWVPLTVGPLGAALLLAGRLPSLSAAWVVPFVVAVPVLVVAGAVSLARRTAWMPAAAVGGAVIVSMAAEAVTGFDAALTPFLGGTQLDGARFYGLPNAFIGLLAGSALYVAIALPVWPGFVVVCATALLAGLPFLGANHGAALTLFAGAGLWLGLRSRGRLGWREVGMAAGVTIVGMAVVVAAHALWPAPTHGTRFVEDVARAPSSLVPALADRLLIGVRLIARSPATAIPVLGVPVCLYVVLRARGVLREALDQRPEWRAALLAILLASAVAYLGNDTGPSAAGLGFGMALGGMLHVSLSAASWKMRS